MPFGYKAAWSSAGTGGATWAEAEALAQRLAEDEQTLKRRFWQKLRALAARLPLPKTLRVRPADARQKLARMRGAN